LPAPASSSGVSICTFVLVKQSEHLLRGIRCDCLRLLRRGPVCRGMRLQLLRRQYLYFCTSKVSKASKPPVARAAGAAVHTHARANAAAHAAAHVYFCASKASKLAARAAVHTHTHARAHAAVCTSKLEFSRSCRCTGGGTYSACPCCAPGGLSLRAFLVQKYIY
jgi:hypothetical protein